MTNFTVPLVLSFLLCLFNVASAVGDNPAIPAGVIIAYVIIVIVCLIMIVLDIVAIVQIIRSPLEDTAKLLYILIILIFPLIGLILWCCMGRRRY